MRLIRSLKRIRLEMMELQKNSQDSEIANMLCEMFCTLISQTRYSLESLKKRYRVKYPKVTTPLDLEGMEHVQKYEALTMLMIPAELKRREIERAYYKHK